jgi:hypothetical protein
MQTGGMAITTSHVSLMKPSPGTLSSLRIDRECGGGRRGFPVAEEFSPESLATLIPLLRAQAEARPARASITPELWWI